MSKTTYKQFANDTSYQTNKTGFVDWNGRLMSIHNFYVELKGSLMEGTNSLYCHTVGWANLHGFGTKNGSLDDKEIWDLLLSVGARFVKYPSAPSVYIPMNYYKGNIEWDGLSAYQSNYNIGGI
tara:strand:+ start:156 stop:527 length:372 start_codon:yes stop_codon:yes gene_type:complete